MNRKQTYHVVIEAEIRSQLLYKSMAKSFRNPETSAIFQELMVLEKNHEEKMRAAYAKEFPGEKVGQLSPSIPQIKDIEMTDPIAVLEFAIGREDMAAEIYRNMAAETEDAEIKALLITFADEEEQHKEVILTEMQRVQGAVIWFDPSELDGLLEH